MRPNRIFRHAIVLTALVAALSIAGKNAGAADAPGCKDAADLKRFAGSSIALCSKRDFAEYTLPTGPSIDYDFDAKRAHFVASLGLEGRLTQNVYAVPPGPSSAEVFRNYKVDLADKGFRILFEGKQAELGPALGSFFENMGPGTQIWGYSPDEARYLAAVKEDGPAKVYLAIYAVEYHDGYEPRFSPQKGQVMVRLDALQVGELTNRMATVSASDIAKGLDQNGKVALYGVLFDFNKATIRPDSRPTLDEIAKYLAANPGQKIYVVGHTDNVGGLESNLALSKGRAAAVAADLTRTYGIANDRLAPNGVGLLAPVASNATENGRAKNRRVELLPR